MIREDIVLTVILCAVPFILVVLWSVFKWMKEVEK